MVNDHQPADLNEGEEEEEDALIGSLLSERYAVLSRIGQGGMSVVYHGKHTLMDRHVAIKMLNGECLKDEKAVSRFQQEAQAVSRLDHPNLIGVHDFGLSETGRHFLIMDLADGVSLAHLLETEGALPLPRALAIFKQVAAGLAHAHDNNVIHRDLKPANVMIIEKQSLDLVKVIDFGIARVIQPDDDDSRRLTLSGEILGTTQYLSPEQCAGRPMDHRSDIYSLGCMMYETISGCPPFRGGNLLETMQMHIQDPPRPFAEACPKVDIPPEVESIVMRTLEKKPADRLQSMHELFTLLELVEEKVLGERSPMATSVPTSATPPARVSGSARAAKAQSESRGPASATLKAAAALGALAVIGLSAYLLAPRMLPSRPPTIPAASPKIPPPSRAALAAWSARTSAGQKAYEDGDWKEAEKQYRAAIEQSLAFGASDPRHISSLKRLADVFYTTGRDQEAAGIDEETSRLGGKAKAAPAEPSKAGGGGSSGGDAVTDRIAGLAKLCHENGQCDTAEAMLKRSVTIAEKTFGKTSQKARDRKNDLAVFYMSMGEHDKAEPLLKQIMEQRN